MTEFRAVTVEGFGERRSAGKHCGEVISIRDFRNSSSASSAKANIVSFQAPQGFPHTVVLVLMLLL